MKLQPVGGNATVKPSHYPARPIRLKLTDSLAFDMTTAEALHLADRLVDAAEGDTSGTTT